MKRKRDDYETRTSLVTVLRSRPRDTVLQFLKCLTLACLAMTCKKMREIAYEHVRSSADELGMGPRTEESDSSLLFALGYILNQRVECIGEPIVFGRVLKTSRPIKWNCNDQYYVDGLFHMINEKGELSTWGSGNFGVLGHGDCEPRQEATKVEGLDGNEVWKAFMGPYHAVAITKKGEVYTWGANDEGQLGHGEEFGRVYTPKLVSHMTQFRVANAEIGPNCTVFLTSCGRVFVTGNNIHDDLGTYEDVDLLEYKMDNYFTPTEITHPEIQCKALQIERPEMSCTKVYVNRKNKRKRGGE